MVLGGDKISINPDLRCSPLFGGKDDGLDFYDFS